MRVTYPSYPIAGLKNGREENPPSTIAFSSSKVCNLIQIMLVRSGEPDKHGGWSTGTASAEFSTTAVFCTGGCLRTLGFAFGLKSPVDEMGQWQ